MFGPHLTLDLYGCDEKKLMDEEFIQRILDELPDSIDMHKISEPNLVVHPGSPNSFDKGGISAFVLIAESHISIHTFNGYGFVTVDIFSCRNFDVDKATKYMIDKFEAKKAEKNFLMRGREFPRNVEKTKKIVMKSRKLTSSFS